MSLLLLTCFHVHGVIGYLGVAEWWHDGYDDDDDDPVDTPPNSAGSYQMSSPVVVLNKNDDETNIFPLSLSSPPPAPISKIQNQENKRQYLTRGQRKQKG